MTQEQTEAVKAALQALAAVPQPGKEDQAKSYDKFRTAYYVAKKYRLQRAEISRLVNASGYVAFATARKIVRAVIQEAAEAGLVFPVELFKEFLGQDFTPSLTPLPPAGEGQGVRADEAMLASN